MRRSTQSDYHERIDRVIQRIAQNLDSELDMNALAEISCFSPYHFHRVYRAMVGETPAATVRRLRLNRAASRLLARGDGDLPQIAMEAGYSGVDSLSRAFKAHFGVTPQRFARQGGLFLERPDVKRSDAMSYSVEIKELPALTLATISHTGPYIEIGGAFERLALWAADRNLLNAETRMIGLYYDDPESVEESALRSAAGLVVASDFSAEGSIGRFDLPAGEYAELLHTGPYPELHKAYRWLYQEWLPHSGREPDNCPAHEEYLNNPRETPPAALLTAIRIKLAE